MTTERKYALVSGYVQSNNDGELHWINCKQLAGLYKVDPKDCYFVNSRQSLKQVQGKKVIYLQPKEDGNYNLPENHHDI